MVKQLCGLTIELKKEKRKEEGEERAEQHTTNFFGCGAMHRLRDLGGLHKLQELPLVNQGWLEAMGGSIQDGPARLLIGLDTLSTGTTTP